MTFTPRQSNARQPHVEPRSTRFAWVGEAEGQRAREAADSDAAFDHMLRRRSRFEADMARVSNPSDAERRDLWARADEETR